MSKIGWSDFVIWQCSLRQRNFRMFGGKPSEGTEALILDNDIQGFIVGLPLHLSGHEGELAAKSRAFGTQLEEIFKLKVFYEDERLTTKQSEYSHRKKGERTDDIAASIILQQFLDRGA